jgi:hypothetical protein
MSLALITGFVSRIIGPVASLIDDLHTSDEEKLIMKAKLMEIEKETMAKAIDFEAELINAKKDIIVAEAQGQSWLQRTWRPLLMLIITIIIANNYILFPYISLFFPGSATMLELPGELYNLMAIGVGGYVVGRTGEKIVTKWKQ